MSNRKFNKAEKVSFIVDLCDDNISTAYLFEKYGRPKDDRSRKELIKYWKTKGEVRVEYSERDVQPEVEIAPDGRKRIRRKAWDVAAFDKEAGEWVTKENYSYEYIEDGELGILQPVEPAKITPTKRKLASRAYKMLLVYGDGQVDYRRRIDPVTDEMTVEPIHDLAAHEVIKQMNAHYMPDYTVNLGDFADMAALSRFDMKHDNWFKTLGLSMRYIHDFYAQLVADNPKGQHHEVDSNHAVRPKQQVLKNLAPLFDFIRPGEENAYPMMTYAYLANLPKLGINFHSGYGEAKFVYGREGNNPNPIIFKHGTHSSSSPGATVRKEALQNPTMNVVRGHGHKSEMIMSTIELPSGERRQLFYAQLGSTCLNNGMVEGYSSSVDDFNNPVKHTLNHQNTIAVIKDYGNGRYSFDSIEIVDGVAYYEGKEFNGKTTL